MKLYRVLGGLGAFCVSLILMTTQTQARVQFNFDSNQHRGSDGVVLMSHEELSRMARSFGLKLHTIKVSKDDLKKLASAKNCGCAIEDEAAGGGWKCFKDCLAGAHVDYATITACGAACGVSLVGCAICVGVGEWVVMGCSMGCAWAPLFSKHVDSAIPASPKLSPSRVHSTRVANLSLRAARSAGR